MRIRKGTLTDIKELQQLFADTVNSVCKTDYNSEQIDVWASSVENERRWQDILTKQFVLIAYDDEKITGFCTLKKGHYIDMLYIHKDHQRQGIAFNLYTEIETEAKRLRQTLLVSDVSITARPFFEKVGFRVLEEQIVKVKGVKMTNFKMTKEL
jgi:putative acetyltransferase